MRKMRIIKMIAIVLFLFIQGCYYAAVEPAYNGGYYEPPPIALEGPPDVIVMPDTDDVYVAPDVNVDLFFWNGFWWRPWEGRWYRSQYYDRGWGYYNGVPSFYFDVDPGWRGYYRGHNWYGHRWNYQRIPHHHLHQNWRSWHNDQRWRRQGTWGIQNYQPRPPLQRQEIRRQRQHQYQLNNPVINKGPGGPGPGGRPGIKGPNGPGPGSQPGIKGPGGPGGRPVIKGPGGPGPGSQPGIKGPGGPVGKPVIKGPGGPGPGGQPGMKGPGGPSGRTVIKGPGGPVIKGPPPGGKPPVKGPGGKPHVDNPK